MIKTDVFIRIAGFLGTFALLAIWEACAPRRALTSSKSRRWVANLGVVVIDALLIRVHCQVNKNRETADRRR